ncbi:MAG: putative response-associated peptidase [Actinotalea sp.]|nr:putative response-associated peptidase [Actinotalea sp.]
MCGRYASFREAQDLADAFAVSAEGIAEDVLLLPPSWNVAPTDAVRVVVEREPRPTPDEPVASTDPLRSLRLAKWGLVPSWAKDPSVGSRMINARVESLLEKSAFRKAVAVRRCLVPAEGYYEWQKPPAGSPAKTPKQPYWIHSRDGSPVAFAGLYEFWRDPTVADDDPHRWLVSMTIVTAGAQTHDPALAAIHDRRPVVLDPSVWQEWLDPRRQDPERAVELLGVPAERLVATPVSTAVNKVGTDGPELIEPVDLVEA